MVKTLVSIFYCVYNATLVCINNPSRHRFSSFFERNAKLEKEIKLEHAGRNSFTEEILLGWFNKLKHILDINDLHFHPAQIWNVDESNFSDETQCK